MKKVPRWILICWLILCAGSGAHAKDDDQSGPLVPGAVVNERVLRVPGDPRRPIMLEVTVLTPPGPGPFKLVVANHGAAGSSKSDQASRYRRTFFAFYLLSRGYAVALPMMRGFGGSGGKIVPHGCNVAQAGRDNAKDIRAVIDFLGTQPEFDSSRVLVIGQSYGGWNSLALGADPPPNLVGLINFSGGMRESDCSNTNPNLIAGAEEFGRQTHVPSIWFYGENDSLFPPALWRAMYEHYKAGGAKAELIFLGRQKVDTHTISKYPEFLSLWTPHLDDFLGGLGLPNQLVHPEYMPKPWPKPTGFAALEDVKAVPYLDDATWGVYRKYLEAPIPKAFFLAPGHAYTQLGGFDPIEEGLEGCRKQKFTCKVYAVDDQVVWVPSPKRPPPSHFAPIEDVNAVPYLTDAGRNFYKEFLEKAGPRALVLAPNGAAYAHFGKDAFVAAMQICQDVSSICEPYAIDGDVVWIPPPPLPGPSSFAALKNDRAVPYLTQEGRAAYRRFLVTPKPRVFIIASDGTSYTGSGTAGTARMTLLECNKLHQGCAIYAIDDEVVWH